VIDGLAWPMPDVSMMINGSALINMRRFGDARCMVSADAAVGLTQALHFLVYHHFLPSSAFAHV
jgi:hypothetical protein